MKSKMMMKIKKLKEMKDSMSEKGGKEKGKFGPDNIMKGNTKPRYSKPKK